MNEALYKYPIALTQQFRHCGNPFRIDTYKGCDFGCLYCFSNNRKGNHLSDLRLADFTMIEKYFKKAFDEERKYKNITVELLKERVPLHLGGMSDPFQIREFKHGLTYRLLELSNYYKYPIIISTKTASLPKQYFDVLNPSLHAFQCSLMSTDDETIRKFEKNTPLPDERINFMKNLHERGFWVGLRVQPLIFIEDAISVVLKCNNYIDFVTVEHLKIPTDNKKNMNHLFDLTGTNKDDYKKMNKDYQLPFHTKLTNIESIKKVSEVPVGCGDNDLHEYSDTNNCCGVDTIGDNFDKWLKYNTLYLNKTGDYSQWVPKCDCSSCFNSESRIKGYGFKQYVDEYLERKIDKR